MPRNYPASVPFRTASEANRLKLAAAKASKTVPKLTPIRPHHKRDFGRFRVDSAKQGRRAFRTPIRGCDIFRNARAACRFFDLPKKTPRGTSATLNLALQDRRGPRHASQNVAQKAAQIAPPRPADVTGRIASEANRLKLAAAKASKTVPKLTPIRPHHKRDFGRFRDDAAKQGRCALRTPIRGCDIFRNARAGSRFFDV